MYRFSYSTQLELVLVFGERIWLSLYLNTIKGIFTVKIYWNIYDGLSFLAFSLRVLGWQETKEFQCTSWDNKIVKTLKEKWVFWFLWNCICCGLWDWMNYKDDLSRLLLQILVNFAVKEDRVWVPWTQKLKDSMSVVVWYYFGSLKPREPGIVVFIVGFSIFFSFTCIPLTPLGPTGPSGPWKISEKKDIFVYI